MIHSFTCNDTHLILDVDSDALYCVDELCNALVPYFSNKDFEGAKAVLEKKYELSAINEAWEELTELVNSGGLDNHYEYGDEYKKKPDVIKSICLNISHDCNLRCEYCFAGTGDFGMDRSMMSRETAYAAIDFLMDKSGTRKMLELDFFGGEPLMNWDVIVDSVKYGRKKEKEYGKTIRFTITTNALALDDEKMQLIDKEMSNVVISVDGRKETHDKYRKTVSGEGSFKYISDNAIKLAKMRENREHYVRGTYTKHNLDFSKDVIALYDMGFEQISIEPVVVEDDSEYAISMSDLPQIRQEYQKLAKKYLEMRKDGKWFNFFHFMIDLDDFPCVSKRLLGCGAGNEYVAITPNGDIFPCHQFVGQDKFVIGNVNDSWFDKDKQIEFAELNVVNNSECKDCWAKYFCCGGCKANAWKMNKNLFMPHKVSCEIIKAHLECALWVYANQT